MPVITISCGSYVRGRGVAEKLAANLGCECLSREIILSASKHFNIPEARLVRAVNDAPSVLDRFTYGKQRCVAYVRQALLDRLQTGHLVYHGPAGHYFLQGVPHLLKVRIVGGMDVQAAEQMRREGLSVRQARKALMKDDEADRSWGHYIFGVDPADPNLYDLIVNMKFMNVDETVYIIEHAAKLPCFQPTAESRRTMQRLFLAARMQASLMEQIPSIKVGVDHGEIVVVANGYWAEGRKLLARIDQLTGGEKEQVRVKVKLTHR